MSAAIFYIQKMLFAKFARFLRTIIFVTILAFIFLASKTHSAVPLETPELTEQFSGLGTFLTAMPTYTYSRTVGSIYFDGEETVWSPSKVFNRQLGNRFAPIMDWKIKPAGVFFFTGNEVGDELYQELLTREQQSNRTPMLYSGFTTPVFNGFFATAEFNQVDHFSQATFDERKYILGGRQDFSWFGENLPAYSSVWGGGGYKGKNFYAQILTGSEYAWVWNGAEWLPMRINPRVEAKTIFSFSEDLKFEFLFSNESREVDSTEYEATETVAKFTYKNVNMGLGTRFKFENADRNFMWFEVEGKLNEYFSNNGFVALMAEIDRTIPEEEQGAYYKLIFRDSVEGYFNFNKNFDAVVGILFSNKGVKMYINPIYDFDFLTLKLKLFMLNYMNNIHSKGVEASGDVRIGNATFGGAAAKENIVYEGASKHQVEPAEFLAKIYANYKFRNYLKISHEWIYRSSVKEYIGGVESGAFNVPAGWFWNMAIEEYIPQLDISLSATLLYALSKERKEFPFGGENRTRFFCGMKKLF